MGVLCESVDDCDVVDLLVRGFEDFDECRCKELRVEDVYRRFLEMADWKQTVME